MIGVDEDPLTIEKCVEEGSAERIFNSPKHPYTLGLLESIPPDPKIAKSKTLPTLEGEHLLQ